MAASVWSNVVVMIPEPIELCLLLATVPRRLAADQRLHVAVNPFQQTILLRVTGLREARTDTEPDPTNGQLREPLHRVRRERCSVVGDDGPRQSVLSEHALIDRPYRFKRSRQKPVTGEQVTTELVCDGQRIAVASIASSEVTFEVGAPLVVRPGRWSRL